MTRRITALLAAICATVLLWTSPVAVPSAAAKSPYPPKTLATATIDAHPGYDPQSRCTPTAKPGTKALLSLLIKTWGGGSSGISRACSVGGTSEHKEGRALDWHMDMKSKSQRGRVDKALTWITANNGEVARRLGIMYVIWNQRIWSTYYPELGWRKMASRGSYTANHKNHVHISLTWDGAMKQTSWWTGVPVTVPLYGKCGVAGKPACLRTIARAGSTRWPYQSTTVPVPFLPAPRNYPNIGGSPRVGLTLTAVPGTWVPDGATLSYQWKRGRTPISGATGATYQLVAADYNAEIRVTVTAAVGDVVLPARTSPGTADIYRGKFAASGVRLPEEAVLGTPLSVNLGTWSPTPTSYRYQWLRDGKTIKKQTAATYLPKASDVGHKLSVRVTGKLAGYTDLTVTTPAVKVVAAFTATPAPTISGSAKVGSTLTANVPAWTPAVASLSYQWFAGDTAIDGATSREFVVTEAQTGIALRVVVTGRRSGYGSVQVSSVATSPIEAATPPPPPETPTPSPTPTDTPGG
ncbi:hypothetical protein ATK74_2845 [Propionicimonas paludicola]|uniref:ARB-07466-like C-terminal domain-containing protein n=1 Tax=Propionicimonas paludicola TaxID=185243 RepID=A0A2A9CVT5_9ACTN|nr:hypothetical protein [Propionicimonas paludicola]PFG18261.1 hypothetical protein ATK74_2845 [Propionicimonas paludicola]